MDSVKSFGLMIVAVVFAMENTIQELVGLHGASDCLEGSRMRVAEV